MTNLLALPQHSRLRSALALAVFLICPLLGHAQIIFTVKATPYEDKEGYTVAHGDYTFTFRMDSFAQNDNSASRYGYNTWEEEELSHAQLFTSLGGDGFHGSYIRPASGADSPSSGIYAGANLSGHFELIVRGNPDRNDTIGVRTLNDTVLSQVSLDFRTTQVNFAVPNDGSYLDPVAYFSAYIGSYSPNLNGNSFYISSLTSQYLVEFDVSSVAISAIPEPSTYAALAGLGAFGLVIWRRRRMAAAA